MLVLFFKTILVSDFSVRNPVIDVFGYLILHFYGHLWSFRHLSSWTGSQVMVGQRNSCRQRRMKITVWYWNKWITRSGGAKGKTEYADRGKTKIEVRNSFPLFSISENCALCTKSRFRRRYRDHMLVYTASIQCMQ